MNVAIRRAWLQKHPSPVASAGEFHWHPREGDRELRAELVARAQGIEPPAVVWELAPGRVVWARAFSAHAPTDGRRYVGLAVVIAEGDAAPSELLAAIDEPDAAPWIPDGAIGDGIDAAGRSARVPGGIEVAVRELPSDIVVDRATPRGMVAIARAAISGGCRRIGEGVDVRALMAAVDRVLPVQVIDKARSGIWLYNHGSAEAGSKIEPEASFASSHGGTELEEDRVAALAAGACRVRAREADAWGVLCEVAAARRVSVDDAWHEATRPPSTWLTEEELAASAGGPLPASWLATRPQPEQLALVDMLHLWGRGRFDLCPTAGTVIERLADAVASRVLVQLADGRDAADAIADARWYSVLPGARRDALRETLVGRVPSLASAWPLEIRDRRLEVRHG